MADKFYAIKHGKKDNVIVTNWGQCQELISGVTDPKFMKFSTYQEAKEWLEATDAPDLSKKGWSSNKVFVYSDGACSGNPGPGGWGTIIRYRDHEIELSGGEEETTNSVMELTAMLQGLKTGIELAEEKNSSVVSIFSDSSYVVNGMTIWMPKWKENDWRKNDGTKVISLDIWQEIDRLMQLAAQKEIKLDIKWIKGHAGHKENERCDALAVAQRDRFAEQLRKKTVKDIDEIKQMSEQTQNISFEPRKHREIVTNYDMIQSIDIELFHKLMVSVSFQNFLMQKDALTIYDMLNRPASDWGIKEIRDFLNKR